MMVYALTWILCDVSLVELHFLGASLPTKVAVACVIGGLFIAWQIFVLKRGHVVSSAPVVAIICFALWQISGLPALKVSVPAAGHWVGKWEGLPNRSSALFHPYAVLTATDAESSARNHCEDQGLPYRLWVRGIKPVHYQQEAVMSGKCVSLYLESDDTGKALPPGIESWRQRNRIVASMRIKKDMPINVYSPAENPVDALRMRIRQNFEQAAPQEEGSRWSFLKKTPVLLALVTGDRALMKPTHWKLFADSGTSHLMAISGSHVSMFAMLVYGLVRRLLSLSTRLTSRIPAQHIALVLGWFGAFGYALLAGFNVPTQRTLVMIGVAVLLRLRGRSLLDWRSWWIALVAVTVYDPLAIFDRGAWLSFFAVALILWVLQGRLRPLGVVKGWLVVQLAIFMGLAPLLAYAFGGFPWISPIANALAIPLTCFVVVPGALVCAFLMSWLPELAELPLTVVVVITDATLWFLQQAAAAGGAGYRVPVLVQGAVVTVCGLLGVLWCLAPRGVPGKGVAMALVLPVLLGPAFHALPLHQEHWLAGKRQGFLYEDEHSLWWLFEAGENSRSRQVVFDGWLKEKGYGYTWSYQRERYADWIKSGFLVHRYDKYTTFPGQIHLREPVLEAPCTSSLAFPLGTDHRLLPVRPDERSCWLVAEYRDNHLLMAGDLTRDVQLAMAEMAHSESIDTLLITPRSGQKLSGAILNRYAPQQVVEWPATSSVFPDAASRLAARDIQKQDFDAFLLRRAVRE